MLLRTDQALSMPGKCSTAEPHPQLIIVFFIADFNHFFPGLSMLATTVGLYLIPFCKTTTLLIAMMSVFGAAAGALDTG